jgi:ABC-type sugar transport system permease subunit
VLFGQILTLHGLLNSSLEAVGLGTLARDWLGNPDYALSSLIGVIVWKELGFGVILFLARLFALPTEVYEAARADGAGWWRTHWHVSLPGLRPIILFYLVIEGITLLSWVFNYVFVMTRGGPGEATGVIETYIYDNLITYRLTWLAASAATVVLGSVAVIAAGVLITRRIANSRAA